MSWAAWRVVRLVTVVVVALSLVRVAVAIETVGTAPGQLSVDPTGQAIYQIPIDVPPGIAGMEPQLSISYGSLAGNGSLGKGWAINGFSAVSRCNARYVPDGFHQHGARFCMDGQKLMLVDGSGTYGQVGSEYRKEIHDLSRITYRSLGGSTTSAGWVEGALGVVQYAEEPGEFIVETSSGLRNSYGTYAYSRGSVIGPDNNLVVNEWRITRTQDRHGNYIDYYYFRDDGTGESLPTAILYTGNNDSNGTSRLNPARAVVFRYGQPADRPDPAVSFYHGGQRMVQRRLEAVETYIGVTDVSTTNFTVINPAISGTLVTSYKFAYENGPATGLTRLKSVQQCGGTGADELCYPPTRFEYTGRGADDPIFTAPPFEQLSPPSGFATAFSGASGDFNGDGIVDSLNIALGKVSGFKWTWQFWQQDFTLPGPGPGIGNDAGITEYADFNGDGYTDVLVSNYDITYPGIDNQEVIEIPGVALYINKGAASAAGAIEFTRESGPYQYSPTKPLSPLPPQDYQRITNAADQRVKPPKPIVADFNGDGLADVLQARWCQPDEDLRTSNCGYRHLYLRNAEGTGFRAPIVLNYLDRIQLPEPGVDIPTFAEADFNGDGVSDLIRHVSSNFTYGQIDVYLAQPTGSVSDNTVSFVTTFSVTRSDTSYSYKLGDFNGDGLSDIFFYGRYNHFGDKNIVYISRGNGEFADSIDAIGNLPSVGNMVLIHPGDANGDGRTDLLFRDSDGGSRLLYSNGCTDDTGSASDDLGCRFELRWDTNVLPSNASGVSIADHNGDGFADIFFSTSDAGPTLYKNLLSEQPNPRDGIGIIRELPDFLSKVTNGLGHFTDIDYSSLTEEGVYQKGTVNCTNKTGDALADCLAEVAINPTMYVVAYTGTYDGERTYPSTEPLADRQLVRYSYADARIHRLGRGFLGFGQTEQVDLTRVRTVTTNYAQSFPHVGMVKSAVQALSAVLSSNPVIMQSNNELATLQIEGRPFPYIASSETWSYDALAVNFSLLSYAKTTSTYNPSDWGFVSQIVAETFDQQNGQRYLRQVTNNVYAHRASDWTLGRLACASVTETTRYGTTKTRSSAFEYDANHGQITKEIVEPSGMTVATITGGREVCGTPDNESARVITEYGYDSFGEKERTTVRAGDTDGSGGADDREVLTQYADANQRNSTTPLVLVTTRAPNNRNDVTTRRLDGRFGAVIQEYGPNGSSLRSEWEYDTLGRESVERLITPDATVTTTTSYSQCTLLDEVPQVAGSSDYIRYSAALQIRSVTSGGGVRSICMDSLGREIAAWDRTASGPIGTMTQYDYRGRVAKSFRNLTENKVTTTSYDALDRPTSITAPDGSKIRTTYSGAIITTTVQPVGDTTTSTVTERNPLGQVVAVTDAAGQITSYNYAPFGDLDRIHPPVGGAATTITTTYDIRGRKLRVNDPNLGTTTYTYYPTGELKTSKDAAGNLTTYYYDKLGRTVRRVETSAGGTLAPVTTQYTYDTAPRVGGGTWIGPLHTVTRVGSVYKELYEYDASARDKLTTYTYATGESYSVAQTYDNFGRPLSTTYPEGALTVRRSYDAYGRIAELYDDGTGSIIWREDSRNADGQITKVTFGNNVLSTVWSYDATTARLTGIQTGAPNGSGTDASVQDLGYKISARGNMEWREDRRQQVGGAALHESFTYDSLDRLKTTTIGSRTVSYEYDELGNLKYRSDLGTLRYYNDKRNNAGPHAVAVVEPNPAPTPGPGAAVGDVDGDGLLSNNDYYILANLIVTAPATLPPQADCQADGQVNALDLVCLTKQIQGASTQPHNTSSYAGEYRYDKNGNLLEGGGRKITYTSFNKPKHMEQVRLGELTTADFEYGAGHQRIRRTDHRISNPGTPSAIDQVSVTTYVGGLFDKTVTSTGTESRYYIYAATGLVAMKVRYDNDAARTFMRYVHTDHLGSVDVMTDAQGAILASSRGSFDAFGKRRQADGWGEGVEAAHTTANPVRGFTGHEQLDDFGLVHMNGRVYDPILGRFMSADPVVQDPYSLQNLNRYTYVLNNPLAYTDPTGYSFKKFMKVAMRIAVVAVMTYATGGMATAMFGSGFIAGAVSGAMTGMVSAGINGGGIDAIAIGALTGGMGGTFGAQNWSTFSQSLAQGAVGGLGSMLSGEGFKSGFLSGFFGTSVGMLAGNPRNPLLGAVSAAVAGGTASVVGGGKFANGATSGAFHYLLIYMGARAEAASSTNLEAPRDLYVDVYGEEPLFGEPQGGLAGNMMNCVDGGLACELAGKGGVRSGGGGGSGVAGGSSAAVKPGSAGGATAGQRFPEPVRNAAKAENPTATCVYCKMEGTATQVDHAIPRARGGNATLDNAQLACPHCNASKGAGNYPKTPPVGYTGPWPRPDW